MATYKGIQGYTVQKLSEDPTASEVVGQLWYNSDAGKFKVGTSGAGAWASAPSLPVGILLNIQKNIMELLGQKLGL
jgi:hypothetical protein